MVLSCLTPSPADTVILQLRTVVTDQESVMDCGTKANTPKYRIVGESQPESVHVAAVAALARNVTRGTDIGRTRLTASAGGPVASFARSMRKTTRRKKKTSKAGDVGTNGLQCKTCKRVFLYAGNLKVRRSCVLSVCLCLWCESLRIADKTGNEVNSYKLITHPS